MGNQPRFKAGDIIYSFDRTAAAYPSSYIKEYVVLGKSTIGVSDYRVTQDIELDPYGVGMFEHEMHKTERTAHEYALKWFKQKAADEERWLLNHKEHSDDKPK